MTEQEALLQIQAIPQKIWGQLSDADNEAIEMSIKAIEKQIAKKPIKDKEFSSLFDCPSCGRRQKIMYEQNYCKVCGQKLDWGE